MNEKILLKLFSDVITDYMFETIDINTISSIEEDLRKVMPEPLKIKMNRKLKAISNKEKIKDNSISLCCDVGSGLFEIGLIEKAKFLGNKSFRFIVSEQGTKFAYEEC